MSIIIETLLFCDGGKACPMDGPMGDGDGRSSDKAQLRLDAQTSGWHRKGQKDYCPECAKRLALINPQAQQKHDEITEWFETLEQKHDV